MTKELGVNLAAIGDDFAFFSGGSFLPIASVVNGSNDASVGAGLLSDSFGFGIGSQSIGSTDFTGAFDALEAKGLVKTLAEPNLIALSGDTASFLAGGEFPVPVAQDTGVSDDTNSSTITVEFKEFGVSLAFTPTVLNDGLINLVVSPEVSAIDERPNSPDVEVSGFDIPSLVTRRATTTVELRDGQSFAIAGLIQSDFSDNIDQFPWLGDLPVVGALFRSTQFRRNETELVILVTPRLVKPAPAGALATPSDNFVAPDENELFLFGRLEAAESGIGPLGAGGAGGIDGSFGHIIQ